MSLTFLKKYKVHLCSSELLFLQKRNCQVSHITSTLPDPNIMELTTHLEHVAQCHTLESDNIGLFYLRI